MKKHHANCQCQDCVLAAGVPNCLVDDSYDLLRGDAMRRFGWLARIRSKVDGFPFSWAATTEGFVRTFGHPELEIVVPMASDKAHSIFCSAAEMMASGASFSPGRKIADLLANGFDVEFAWSLEGTAKRLRMILPDGHNQTRLELMKGKLARQWEVTVDYLPPPREPQEEKKKPC